MGESRRQVMDSNYQERGCPLGDRSEVAGFIHQQENRILKM